jgi:hypothetical protein
VRYRPVPHLRPNTRYLLAVHLAPKAYVGGGVVSVRGGAGFVQNIDDWIRDGAPDVTLTALALPDPYYFEAPTSRAKPLTVQLDRIRRQRLGQAPPLPADPLGALATGPNRDGVYGEVLFDVRTGPHEGHASVGFSFWDPQGRPLEEVSATFCISKDADAASFCAGLKQVAFGLGGVDSLRAAGQSAAAPDASLHFVEMSGDGAMGVFRNATWPSAHYLTWRLRDTIATLQHFLEHTMVTELDNARHDPKELAVKGNDLYEMFFPSSREDGIAARAAFEDFLRAHAARVAANPLVDPPSIFVRMVPSGPAPAPIVPFGLVAPKLKDQDEPRFVGLDFRIEIPLPVQNYAAAPDCLSRWSVVVPPENAGEDALDQARKRLEHRIGGWDTATLFQEMAKFGDWTRKEERDPVGTAVVVVSHHDHNRFWFTARDSITPLALRRRFTRPSLAVLSGCGTGGPGALEFIRRFSEHGMGAIIATNTQVGGDMAGHFVDCLAKVVEDNASVPGFNVSRAYFAATRCMRTKDDARGRPDYGARVLLYTFLGNGALRLCPPARGVQ